MSLDASNLIQLPPVGNAHGTDHLSNTPPGFAVATLGGGPIPLNVATENCHLGSAAPAAPPALTIPASPSVPDSSPPPQLSSPPPVSFGLDRLRVTYRDSSPGAVTNALSELSLALGVRGRCFTHKSSSWCRFTREYIGPEGARIRYGDSDSLVVDLPGGACRRVGILRFPRLLQFLAARRESVCREIHAAWDDYSHGVTVAKLASLSTKRSPHIITRTSLPPLLTTQQGEPGGTLYYGRAMPGARKAKPKALRELCVYDKRAESAGRIDATRVELRLRHDNQRRYADTLLRQLAASHYEVWSRIAAAHLVAFVDFRRPTSSGRKNPSVAARYDWWAQVVGDVVRFRLPAPPSRTPAAWLQWFVAQFSASFAAFHSMLGTPAEQLDYASRALFECGLPRTDTGKYADLCDLAKTAPHDRDFLAALVELLGRDSPFG